MRVPGAERSGDLRALPGPARRYATVPAYDGIAARIALIAPVAGAALLALALVLTGG